jgi:hypothetical protein
LDRAIVVAASGDGAMKSPIVLVALLIVGILTVGPAAAGDRPAGTAVWRSGAPAQELPFPRSERAQSVWNGGACWSECGSHCAWGFAGCLKRDAQGHCLQLTDTCDRYCQRQCRTQGGPFVPDIFDF